MLSCDLLLLPFSVSDSVSDSERLVYACCPSHLIRTLIYSLNACDCSNIYAIWSRIGGDARGAKSRGNRDISDNISGRACHIRLNQAATVTPIQWLFNNTQFIQFSVLVAIGRSIQFCDLLLLPLPITLSSGKFAPIK